MVSPEGAGSPEPRRRTGGSIGVGAAIAALAIGVIGISAITSPTEEAAPETTITTTTSTPELDRPLDLENFDVDQIATGEPLAWEMTVAVPEGYPVAVMEHAGWLYVFSSEIPNFSAYSTGGLRAWRSMDGVTWESLGEVFDESHAFSRVVATDQGIIALETDPDMSGITAWQSEDGTSWEPNEIPMGQLTPVELVRPFAAGGSQETLVVATDVEVNVQSILDALVQERYGSLVDLTYSGWDIDTSDVEQLVFRLWGPLGFPILEIDSDELGLSEEEEQRARDAYSSSDSQVEMKTLTEGSQWVETRLEGASWIESVTVMPGGGFLATGGGFYGSSVWSSADGVTWERLGSGPYPWLARRWGDRVIGPSPTGLIYFLESDDGSKWEPLGESLPFPLPISWGIQEFGAGPGGVAALVTGWEPYDSGGEESAREAITIESGAATLSLNYWGGDLVVDSGDRSHRWTMSGPSVPDGVETHLERGVIAFHDPDTGELLGEFDIDAINDAQRAYWDQQGVETQHNAVIFSQDGLEWSIQGVREDMRLTGLVVTENRVIATAVDGGSYFSPDGPPGFEIWSAPIP